MKIRNKPNEIAGVGFPLLREMPAFLDAVRQDTGNPVWDVAPFRILIVRLSRFEDIAKSTSHLVLFSEARAAAPEAFIDLAFLPDRQDRDSLLAGDFPWFFGRASHASPAAFDLILVSNAFALELINLPYLFSTAGLAVRSSSREESGVKPIAILGGSNAALAGCIVMDEGGDAEDSLVDAIFFGEGEGSIGEIVLNVKNSQTRQEALQSLSYIEGMWLPGAVSHKNNPYIPFTQKKLVKPAPNSPTGYPVFNSSESDTARLMITAGCPGLCSFCLEGWDRLPYREIPLAEIIDSARKLRIASGARTLEVYSFNFNTHESVFELFFELGKIFRRVNFMSQRVDILARTPGLAAAEFAADKHSFTLGIEGISDRMRRFYRKGLTTKDIRSVLDRLLVPGLRELKLFFIIAGIETREDIAEFGSFVASIAALKSARSAGTRLLVSAGYLVRLPFTPLQFAALELDKSKLESLAAELGKLCEMAGVEFRIASRFDEFAVDQALATGGSTFAPWIESIPSRGFTYDSSLSRGAWPSLDSFAAENNVFSESFLSEKTREYRPPLGFMERPERHEILWNHYIEARESVDRTLCLGAGCSDCGACLEPEDMKSIAGHHNAVLSNHALVTKIARLVAAKNAFVPVRIPVTLPESIAGSTAEYKTSWLLRTLSKVHADAWKVVFDAHEVMFSEGFLAELLPRQPGFWGKCVFELSGPDASAIAQLLVAVNRQQNGQNAIPGFHAGQQGDSCTVPEKRVNLEIIAAGSISGKILPAFRKWLSENHIEATEKSSMDGVCPVRAFMPAARDLRKGIIQAARIREEDSRTVILLGAGLKARVGDFLDLVDPCAHATVAVRVIDWE